MAARQLLSDRGADPADAAPPAAVVQPRAAAAGERRGAGNPRAYGIALELISHVDGRVDCDSLNGFIASYQTVHPLKLGELWAMPIMLRLALIENLRRVAARVAAPGAAIGTWPPTGPSAWCRSSSRTRPT